MDDLGKRLSVLSEQRVQSQWALQAARSEYAFCQSPASGPVFLRVPAGAAAARRVAAALAADQSIAESMALVQAEADALRTEQVSRERARQAARSDAELAKELRNLDATLARLGEGLQAASNAAFVAEAAEHEAGRQRRAPPPAGIDEQLFRRLQDEHTSRESAYAKAVERRRASFAAVTEISRQSVLTRGQRDQLEGELDRRSRSWQPPAPVSVPALPDGRLPDDERLDALASLVPQLEGRCRRALASCVAADTQLRQARSNDDRLSHAVAAARYHDADLDQRQRLADLQAINRRLREAEAEAQRLERATVAAG